MALYDPNEFPETKVGTDFTIADVLAWARTKPADEEYSYFCDRCAVGQFLTETGRCITPAMGNVWYLDDSGNRIQFPAEVDTAARGGDEWEGPRTFGAFVKRLESALA